MKCNDFKCYVIYLINDEFKYTEENVQKFILLLFFICVIKKTSKTII